MTGDEYRTHMTLWSLLAAPLLAGNDLRAMSEETKGILMNAEVIAIDQDLEAKPLKVVNQDGQTAVLARPLKDQSVAVGLFNRGDQPAEVGVNWSVLNLPVGKLQVRDLWKQQNVEASGNRYSVTVPNHGLVLLKASVAP